MSFLFSSYNISSGDTLYQIFNLIFFFKLELIGASLNKKRVKT